MNDDELILMPSQVDVGELTHTLDVTVLGTEAGVLVQLSMPAKRKNAKGTRVHLAEATVPNATEALKWIESVASALGRRLDAQARAALKAKGYRLQ